MVVADLELFLAGEGHLLILRLRPRTRRMVHVLLGDVVLGLYGRYVFSDGAAHLIRCLQLARLVIFLLARSGVTLLLLLHEALVVLE